jgi:fluoride ion exporter CrcB/FEX
MTDCGAEHSAKRTAENEAKRAPYDFSPPTHMTVSGFLGAVSTVSGMVAEATEIAS